MKRLNVYAAVIGGGASGMMCALRAAERRRDKRFVIIEKADRVGKKLLVTGNGRCNLTAVHAHPSGYHGEDSEELIDILFKKYDPKAVLEYFRAKGLFTRFDTVGRVYPLSNNAASVLDVLRSNLTRLGVDELCGADVRSIKKSRGGWEIALPDTLVTAEKLVIAVGGKTDHAGRESGAAQLIRAMGLKTTELRPSLCPVKVGGELIRSLKGIRVEACATLIKDSKILKKEVGEVQFTDSALSGICIFNLSRSADSSAEISLSLIPDMTAEKISDELRSRASLYKNSPASELFTGIFHKNIAIALLKTCGIRPSSLCKDISEKELKALADTVSDWRFRCVGDNDFKKAQVTAGGVKLSEIDPRTFEHKHLGGLYIIGEALDIDGDCGGYNLQFAWASGMCAGDSL